MVEQRTENPRVPSSILGLGTTNKASGSSSVVERLLAKEKVASSNLVFRSSLFAPPGVIASETKQSFTAGIEIDSSLSFSQ